MSKDKITVLLVEDHAIMLDGLQALLSAHQDIEIVGAVTEGKESIKKAQELAPDVIIMDIALPGGINGIEATRLIRRDNPEIKILVVTQYDNSEYILAALKAGANGYLPKLALSSELLLAIRAVHRGESFLYPSAAQALMKSYQQKDIVEAYELLTATEKEILRLFAEGYTSREIAKVLKIRLNIVLSSRTKIMGKLDLRNRTDLIKYAVSKGLVDSNK